MYFILDEPLQNFYTYPLIYLLLFINNSFIKMAEEDYDEEDEDEESEEEEEIKKPDPGPGLNEFARF